MVVVSLRLEAPAIIKHAAMPGHTTVLVPTIWAPKQRLLCRPPVASHVPEEVSREDGPGLKLLD